MDLVPGPFSASTIASLEAVAVADITNPTELNSLAGTVVGERRVAYQVVGNDNLYTVYFWDSADGAGASSPYVVAGSAGFWIAAGGRYTNSAVSLRSTLLVSGAVTLSSTLAAGASTLASLGVTGAATVGTTLGVTGTSTLAGLDATSIGATTRGTGLFTTLGANGTSTLAGVTCTSLTDSGLTSGRVPFATTGGLLTDSASLLFSGTVLTVGQNIIAGLGTAGASFVINGLAGTARDFAYQSAGSNRWLLRCNTTAESGANAGSNLELQARDDAGSLIDTPVTLARVSGGTLAIARPVTVAPGSTNSILLSTSSNYGFLSFNNSASFTAGVAIAGAGGSDNDMYFLVPSSRGFHWRTNNVETVTLTSAGNLTTIGTFQALEVIVSSGAANAALTLTTSTNGNQRYIKFVDTAGSKYNFQVGAQITVSDAWEIIPSTAAGGSTFSTPALYVNGATGTVRVPTTTDASDWVNAAFSTLGGVAMAKNLWVGSDSLAGCALYLNCAAANGGFIKFNSASTLRWQMGRVGSTHAWRIEGYDASGVLTDIPLTIANAAGGAFTIVRPISASSTVTATGDVMSSGGNVGSLAYFKHSTSDTSSVELTGSNATSGTFAGITVYGKSHASQANRIFYDSGRHGFRSANGGTDYLTIDGTTTTSALPVTITGSAVATTTLTLNNTTTAASSWALKHLDNGDLQIVQPSQNTWFTFTHTNGKMTALGPLVTTDGTASTSNSTGAIIATGGIGCGGKIFSGGGVVTSSQAGFGYATGAGGTVAQSSSKSTTVVINNVCGTITMNNAALGAATSVAFTATNSSIAATDVIAIVHDSVGTLGGYSFAVTPAAGSATITVRNNTAGSLSEAIVLRFVVIKAVTS